MTENQANLVAFYLGFIPRPYEPFSSVLVSGFLARLHEYHKDLLLYGCFRQDPQEVIYPALLQKKIDGFIFIPPKDHPLTTCLSQSGLPVVAIADPAPGIISVMVNDEMGAFMLAEHLALRGHRKVLFRKDPYDHESAVRRMGAFVKSAEYLGMEVTVTQSADHTGVLSAQEESLLFSPPGRRPSAVVCWSDTFAYATLKFCKAHSISVPKDLAVSGFDGIPGGIEPARRLTTIQAPWFLVAEKAVDLLIQMMRGEDVIRETILPIDLVIGDTT